MRAKTVPIVFFHSLLLILILWTWTGFPQATASENKPWIPFEALRNTRDAGGYRVGETLRIRSGVLFRSERLFSATEGDIARLKALGIRKVVDLRALPEAALALDPVSVLTFATYTQYPIDLNPLPTAEALYLDIVNTYAPSMAGLFHEIANPENLPILYHCTWGKDRTGIATALIHLLLGVDRETVLKDYLLSNEVGYWVESSWLEAVLKAVEEEGGIEPFLLKRGVPLTIQSAVRANLLEKVTRVERWKLYSN